MISVRLSGGLGNQLFQYAVASSINTQNDDIEIEYNSVTTEGQAERKLSITTFSIPSNYSIVPCGNYNKQHPVEYLLQKIIRGIGRFLDNNDENGMGKISKTTFRLCNLIGYCVQEKHRYYYPHKRNPLFIYGMWHSPIYPDQIKEELKEYYHVKKECLSESAVNLIKQVSTIESVCVHVRRGDYMTATGFSICSIDYYLNSISCIKDKINSPVFFVFSDDIEWCRNNIVGENIQYMEALRPDYEDFEIMRNCKHFIISNSTFSWWAAYLGERQDSCVITPKTWFDDSPKKNLNLPGWIEIDR